MDNVYIVGRKKVSIGGFEFFEEDLKNPMFVLTLLAIIDPTEKQREVLNASKLRFLDANNKDVFTFEKKEE